MRLGAAEASPSQVGACSCRGEGMGQTLEWGPWPGSPHAIIFQQDASGCPGILKASFAFQAHVSGKEKRGIFSLTICTRWMACGPPLALLLALQTSGEGQVWSASTMLGVTDFRECGQCGSPSRGRGSGRGNHYPMVTCRVARLLSPGGAQPPREPFLENFLQC